MIEELKRTSVPYQPDTRVVWFFFHLGLSVSRTDLPVDGFYPAYEPPADDGDYMSEGLEKGGIGSLKSVTIIPAPGRVEFHNEIMTEPSLWEGSLKPLCNGIFFNSPAYFKALKPSAVYCVCPPLDRRYFGDRILRREFVAAGDSLTFQPRDIGFAVAWGADCLKGFSAEAGDVFTATEDTVLGVVSEPEEGNGD